MKLNLIALVAGSVLLSGLALADQSSVPASTENSPPITIKQSRIFTYQTAQEKPAAEMSPKDSVLVLPAYEVNQAQRAVYREVNDANAQRLSMEPCALVTDDMTLNRQLDFFLAPVPLLNKAAGFPIVQFQF